MFEKLSDIEKIKLLEEANTRYYSNLPLLMSDSEFDELAKSVNYRSYGFGSGELNFRHNLKQFVGTLYKTFTFSEIIEFNEEFKTNNVNNVIWSWKIDGNSVVLGFNASGECVMATTRGDGEYGKNLFHIFKHVKINPLKDMTMVNIKFEATVLWDDLPEDYSSPRSCITGYLSRLEITDEERRRIKLVPLRIETPMTLPFIEEKALLESVCTNNIFVHNNFELLPIFDETNFNNIVNYAEKERCSLPFQIDGIVLQLNSPLKALWKGDIYPLYSVAFKLKAQSATTRATKLEFTYGRSGRITPVIEFEAVTINGHVYKKCSLSSLKRLRNLMPLGKGSPLLFTLRNDVLGYCEKLHSEESTIKDEFEINPTCSYCNHPLDLSPKNNLIFCSNPECENTSIGQMTNFTQKIGIKSFTESFFSWMYTELGVKSLEKLLRMISHPQYDSVINHITNLNIFRGVTPERFKQFTDEMRNIIVIQKIEFSEFLYAVSINGLGKSNIQTLSNSCNIKDEIQQIIKTSEFRREIKGWTKISVDNFVTGIEQNKKMFEFALNNIEFKQEQIISDLDSSGQKKKSVCFSGKLLYNKQDLISLNNKTGKFIIVDSFTSDTDILVTDESKTKKIEKATKLGKQIISSNEFAILLKE